MKPFWHGWLLFVLITGSAWAGSMAPVQTISVFEYQFEFADDQDRMRYQALTHQLRCPKCQNNNIADSDAPIARDIRQRVYQLMQQGQDNEQIVDHLIARYGDFVTYRPPFTARTAIIWLLPVLALALALWAMLAVFRQRQQRQVRLLTEQEQARFYAWLEGKL